MRDLMQKHGPVGKGTKVGLSEKTASHNYDRTASIMKALA